MIHYNPAVHVRVDLNLSTLSTLIVPNLQLNMKMTIISQNTEKHTVTIESTVESLASWSQTNGLNRARDNFHTQTNSDHFRVRVSHLSCLKLLLSALICQVSISDHNSGSIALVSDTFAELHDFLQLVGFRLCVYDASLPLRICEKVVVKVIGSSFVLAKCSLNINPLYFCKI